MDRYRTIAFIRYDCFNRRYPTITLRRSGGSIPEKRDTELKTERAFYKPLSVLNYNWKTMGTFLSYITLSWLHMCFDFVI